MKFAILISAIVSAVVFCGCASSRSGSYQDSSVYREPLYGAVMKRSFSYEGPARNPVIVIHGLLGSKLQDFRSGQSVWGDFVLSTMLSGSDYPLLAHPMAIGKPLNKLKNETRSSGLLERSRVQVLGMQFHLDNYDVLVNTLLRCGYVSENKPLPDDKKYPSLFIFHYDWRRDISENAVELGAFIREKRKLLRQRYRELYSLDNYDVQFDLIGHSMGGLLARYFLRFGGKPLPEKETDSMEITWAGAKFVDKVIIVGTPNAGYVDTLLEMTGGLRLVKGAPMYPPALLGTFVSYYQMLPNREGRFVVDSRTGKALDCFDPSLWIRMKWGLADPGQDVWLKQMLPHAETAGERSRIALDHLKKCLKRARQFKRAMQSPGGVMPDDVSVYLIAGDAVMTNHTLGVAPDGKLSVLKQDSGDGKITAASARMDLRDGASWIPCMLSPINWSAVYYTQGGHMGIMKSDMFASNLSYLLLASPTGTQRKRMLNYLNSIGKTGHAD